MFLYGAVSQQNGNTETRDPLKVTLPKWTASVPEDAFGFFAQILVDAVEKYKNKKKKKWGAWDRQNKAQEFPGLRNYIDTHQGNSNEFIKSTLQTIISKHDPSHWSLKSRRVLTVDDVLPEMEKYNITRNDLKSFLGTIPCSCAEV